MRRCGVLYPTIRIVLLLLPSLPLRQAHGQTAIDLRAQARNVDFSTADMTKPSRVGTALPTTCTVGETYFLTTANAGQNLYGCPSMNAWALLGGNAGVLSVFGRSGAVGSQSGDYSFTQISGTVSNGQLSSGIDATKIGAGTVNSTEFGYLANVTSDVQAQIDGKASSSHAHNLGGDLSGNTSSGTVVALRNRSVATVAPADKQVLTWNATANQWEPQTANTGGGAGGASMSSQLGDLEVSRTSGTALTVGANCSTSTPCNVRFGNTVYGITASATVTINAGTGTAYVYVADGGSLTVGHNMTVSCSGCAQQSGTAFFPADSVPLWTWVANNGQWLDGGGTDRRAWLSTKNVTAGTGLTAGESGGLTTLSLDTAVVPTYATGTSQPSGSCQVGQMYFNTAANKAYNCTSTNTWSEITSSGSGLPDPGANGIVKRTATNTTAAAKADDLSSPMFCIDSGTSDSYACNLSPAITTYSIGAHYRFKANTANTGAATLNLNGIGAVPIKNVARGGATSDVTDNDIRAGQWVDVVYDGTNFQMQSTSGSQSSGALPITDAVWLPAAGGVQSGVNRPLWNLPSTGAATPEQNGTAPFSVAYLSYAATGTTYAVAGWKLPSTWDGGTVAFSMQWGALVTGSGNVVWRVETACTGDGGNFIAPTFNAAQSQSVGSVVANQRRTTSWDLTTTGCTPGNLMFIRVSRDGDNASDDFASTSKVLGGDLSFKRHLQ